MTLTRITLGLVVISFAIMGIACGIICLICLTLYLFWQGLGVSSLVLAFLCLFCLSVAIILSGWARNAAKSRDHMSGSLRTWLHSLDIGNGRAATGSLAAPHEFATRSPVSEEFSALLQRDSETH